MSNVKINLGSGRKKKDGYTSIDLYPYIDGTGQNLVDIEMDIEHEMLPYATDTVSEIIADNILEHVEELRFVLNECHRVLKADGYLKGCVPVAGTEFDYRDPTHKRHFIKETFDYFTGVSLAKPTMPAHPKYADYKFLPWNKIELKQENDLIYFILQPRKV